MGFFKRHIRTRHGESRRKARLFYQQILEEMDRERRQLNEQCVAHGISEDEKKRHSDSP
jgi:hypothetical protein